jgi:DNA (cytosine-5)-methyltransferase 1
VTGRSVPYPIEAGTRGQPRLSSRFVEWLMGLPAGFVTDLGLPRNAELRALGNGVVPQQAERALRKLICGARHLYNN